MNTFLKGRGLLLHKTPCLFLPKSEMHDPSEEVTFPDHFIQGYQAIKMLTSNFLGGWERKQSQKTHQTNIPIYCMFVSNIVDTIPFLEGTGSSILMEFWQTGNTYLLTSDSHHEEAQIFGFPKTRLWFGLRLNWAASRLTGMFPGWSRGWATSCGWHILLWLNFLN